MRESRPKDFLFFNDTATTEIYTLSLHDALPISFSHGNSSVQRGQRMWFNNPTPLSRLVGYTGVALRLLLRDRKSTRLNSSHANISYAVFCLKKQSHSLSASTGEPVEPTSPTDIL